MSYSFSQIFEKTPWILSIPLLGILGIVIFLNFHLFRLKKEFGEIISPSPRPLDQRYLQEAEKVSERLKEEIATFSAEPMTAFKEECLDVPIFGKNPWNGSYMLKKPEKFTFDFYYVGKIVEVVEKKVGDCKYNTIVLERAGLVYELYIPQGIVSGPASVWPGVYPQILGYHPGKTVQLRIRYTAQVGRIPPNETKTEKLRLIEWEIYLFRLD